jgi:hypothetical protein
LIERTQDGRLKLEKHRVGSLGEDNWDTAVPDEAWPALVDLAYATRNETEDRKLRLFEAVTHDAALEAVESDEDPADTPMLNAATERLAAKTQLLLDKLKKGS